MTEFIANNWVWLLPTILTVGGVIVKATPTKVDDAWWRKIMGVIDVLRKKQK